MSVASLKPHQSVKELVTQQEWRCRVELAACYRLMAHMGIEDMTYNHVSARVPGQPDQMLVKPHDYMFGEVTASSLFKYHLDGTATGPGTEPILHAIKIIHSNIFQARPDVHCVAHTHSPANMAVSAQECGLLPITQHALVFYDRIAYHDFEGFEFEDEGKDRLVRDLGDKYAAIMRNHGSLVAGRSIAEAYVKHHYLEMACRAQVGALGGGTKIVIPSKEHCEFAANQMDQWQEYVDGGKDWAACLRLADRIDPSYKS